MSDQIVIITPELTAGAGGVADYTLRLMEEWGDRITARVILPNETKNELSNVLPASGGKALLQYSAYGFDPRGYPKKLLRSLVDWKKTSRGLLVIMFHEIWAFWPLLNKNRFVQSRHRADLGKLLAVADAVFTSTPSQVEHLRKLDPRCNPQVMAVGSNIRRTATADAKREAGCAVVFGLQATRLRTLRQFGKLPDAIAKIITCGAQNTPAGDAKEEKILQRLGLTSGYEMRGALAEREISQLLGRATYALSAQDELSLMKSGTFMACAAHGLNIISPAADSLGAEPLCWLTSPEELGAGISPNELETRAKNLREWQARTSAWSMIAGRFAEALQFEKAVAA
ncbi:MAG: hypothetical protein M3128_12215 [Verrucomicrobiota bacterium]|nr:hypothetical protein [Verrucomicrobiota bacterium]